MGSKSGLGAAMGDAPHAGDGSAGLLARLLALSGAIAAARTPAQVAAAIVKEGAGAVRAAMGAFVQATPDGQLEVVASHGLSDVALRAWRRFSPQDVTPVSDAYRSGEPLWIESPDEFAKRFGAQPHAPIGSSVASIPLLLEGRVLGVVTFRFDGPRTFTPEERALLLTMGSQAAQALDRAQAYAREIAARLRVEALSALSEALSRAVGTSDVARVVVERGKEVAHADTCVLYVLDETTRALELLGQRGCSPQVVEVIQRITHESDNPVYATIVTGESLWAETPEEYGALFPRIATLPAEGPRAKALWSMPLMAEGRAIGLLGMGFYEPRRFSSDERDFIGTFTRHCAEALLRARRLDAEHRARELADRLHEERKLHEARRAFLADATATLAESLDFESTLAKVARLAVPALADWCAVDLLQEGERVPTRLAVAHIDPAKVELAREIHAKYPVSPDSPTGVPHVLRTGQSELFPLISDEMLVAGCVDDEHLRIARSLGLRSAMCVPLTGRSRVLGAISFVSAESGRTYTPDDLQFAEDLARRCAIAIENARLYASEQEARRSADVANRAKDEFLAVVSHELRTPLNAIMGWSRMLSSRALDDARRVRAVETIDRNAVAMAQLIEDLLDVSRIISGKMRLEMQRVDVPHVVDAAIEAVRPAAEAKGIHIVADLDRSVPALPGDPSRMQQIAWNLLSNAVKFTPGGGRVEVRLALVSGNVEIRVADSGKGIAPTFLPFVFDAFRQEEMSHTASRGGLGLGLAITKQLVELHGGSIEARSEGEGRGAVFTTRFPASAAPRTPSVRVGVEPSSGRPRPRLDGLRVLVVDDDADARQLVQAVLEESRARVTLADSADAALASLEREVPDVLVSDVGMPGRDGYDLIREMRARPPGRGGSVPAAALTAYARAEDRRRLLDAGFSMHLAKPFEPDELIAVVADLARFAGPG